MNETTGANNFNQANNVAPPTTDAALAARLERLASTRTSSGQRPGGSSTSSGSAKKGTKAGRRAHPSSGSRAASLALSLATTGALTYAFAISGSGAALSGSTGTGAAAAASSTTNTDGTTTVVGSADSNRWGVVQVAAVFGSDGSLTAVNVLQTPDGEGKSVEINSYATPTLTSEALSAQSAKINTVSGATYTSESYARSLQAAIDSARTSGITTLA